MSDPQDLIESRFPGVLEQRDFVTRSHDALTEHGFNTPNAIACVGVCRDELCRSLVWTAQDVWGEAFNFSSLGGILTLGTAGFRAAHQHAPLFEGRERYVYIVMPHIGVSAVGALGQCERPGRHGSSDACGAVNRVLAERKNGPLDLRSDPDNLEYSLLKQRLAPSLAGDDLPDITQLTISLASIIGQELERMIALTVDTTLADYAVLTGVQIHLPVKGEAVWPDRAYAVVRGKKHELTLSPSATWPPGCDSALSGPSSA